MERDSLCKCKQKSAGVAMFVSDETDFKTKAVRDKEGHFTMIKESIQQEDIQPLQTFTHPSST